MMPRETDQLVRRRGTENQFLGTVTAISGNHIQIKRTNQSSPDTIFYSAAAGLAATVAVGDRVAVFKLSGTYTVGFKVV